MFDVRCVTFQPGQEFVKLGKTESDLLGKPTWPLY